MRAFTITEARQFIDVVVEEAANRMHVQKGLLAWLLGPLGVVLRPVASVLRVSLRLVQVAVVLGLIALAAWYVVSQVGPVVPGVDVSMRAVAGGEKPSADCARSVQPSKRPAAPLRRLAVAAPGAVNLPDLPSADSLGGSGGVASVAGLHGLGGGRGFGAAGGHGLDAHLEELGRIASHVELLLLKPDAEALPAAMLLSNVFERTLAPWLRRLEDFLGDLHERNLD